MFSLTHIHISCTNEYRAFFFCNTNSRITMSIAPTAVWKISTSVVDKAWGRPQDWGTSLLKMEGNQPEAMEVIGLLGGLAQEYNLGRIFSPTVSEFNSEFLNDTMQSPWKLSLPGTACKLYRGLKVDGSEIHPGDAGVVAPADCAVIIVTTPSGRVLMLHAGRNSLVDRICIDTKGEIKSKRCESIIFTAWNDLHRVCKDDALNSKWFILPSIMPGPLATPQAGQTPDNNTHSES